MALPPSTTTSKRIVNEINVLQQTFVCIVNPYSIEVFYNTNTRYIFRELKGYPFKMPIVTIISGDLIGNRWIIKSPTASHAIDLNGEISLEMKWVPQAKMIDIINFIEQELVHKEVYMQ